MTAPMIAESVRSPAVLEAAERALVAAEAAEAEASATVSHLREELAIGRIPQGTLIKSQRELAKRQEAVEASKALIRAVTREAEVAREADRSTRESARALKARDLSAARDVLQAQIAMYFAQIEGTAAGLDLLAADWNDRANSVRKEGGGAQPGHLTRPSDLGMAWGRFIDGLHLLRREYPVQKART